MKRKKLEELRCSFNLSFGQMAIKVGISKPFYWQIEKGKRRLNYCMAVKIANVFNLKPDEVFYDEEIERIKS